MVEEMPLQIDALKLLPEASVASFKMLASSTFSAYDQRIAKVFGMTPCGEDSDGGNNARLDDNECCTLHPFIQLKVKLPSGKWTTLSRTCVVCQEEDKSGHAATSSTRPSLERSQDRKKLHASVQVTMKMHESRDLSLTPSCLEVDNDRRKCVETSADDASSRGSVEHKTKNSVACSIRVSQGDVKESPAAQQLPFEVSIPHLIKNFVDKSVMSKHSLDLLM